MYLFVLSVKGAHWSFETTSIFQTIEIQLLQLQFNDQNYTLDQLEQMPDPAEYFRINRKVIVNINTIQKAGAYFNSRLKITAPWLLDDNSIVSRERVNDFKEWLGR